MSAFYNLPVVSWVGWESYVNLQEALAAHQFHVLPLDGRHIDSREAFFTQVAQDLPADPPLGRSKWDALNDSLYNGLGDLAEPRIAVVWLRSDVLLTHDAEVLYTALDVFRQVAADLSGPALEAQTDLRVFLIGAGPSFKPFSSRLPFRSRY